MQTQKSNETIFDNEFINDNEDESSQSSFKRKKTQNKNDDSSQHVKKSNQNMRMTISQIKKKMNVFCTS